MSNGRLTKDGEATYGGQDIIIYPTNVSNWDRNMKNKMQRDGSRYYTYTVPSSTLPRGHKASMRARIDSARSQYSAAKDNVHRDLKLRIANIKAEYYAQVKGGRNQEIAREEMRNKVHQVREEAKLQADEAKRSAQAVAADIKKTLLRGTSEMARNARNMERMNVRELEHKIHQTQELVASRKLSENAGKAIVSDAKRQMADKLKDMKESDINSQIHMIQEYQKIGQISPKTAKILIARQIWRRNARPATKKGWESGVSYIPVDKETGRPVSPQDLDLQIAYRKKMGINAGRLQHIRKSMARPNHSNPVKVRICLIPEARFARPPTGEGIYSTQTTGPRIQVVTTKVDAPIRAVAPEAIPSAEFQGRQQMIDKQQVAMLQAASNQLGTIYNSLYARARALGITDNAVMQLKTQKIAELKGQIRNGKNTGSSLADLQERFQQLNALYKNQIGVLKTAIASFPGGGVE
jgi:hypothetical protein